MSTSGLGGRYCILWPGLVPGGEKCEDLAESDERWGGRGD